MKLKNKKQGIYLRTIFLINGRHAAVIRLVRFWDVPKERILTDLNSVMWEAILLLSFWQFIYSGISRLTNLGLKDIFCLFTWFHITVLICRNHSLRALQVSAFYRDDIYAFLIFFLQFPGTFPSVLLLFVRSLWVLQHMS